MDLNFRVWEIIPPSGILQPVFQCFLADIFLIIGAFLIIGSYRTKLFVEPSAGSFKTE